MKPKLKWQLITLVLVSMFFIACGGGGGSGNSTTNPTNPPVLNPCDSNKEICLSSTKILESSPSGSEVGLFDPDLDRSGYAYALTPTDASFDISRDRLITKVTFTSTDNNRAPRNIKVTRSHTIPEKNKTKNFSIQVLDIEKSKIPFIFEVETTADSQRISMATPSTSTHTYLYDVSIDQTIAGVDQNVDFISDQTGDFTYPFTNAGKYKISITGWFPHLQLTNSKIVKVKQWGDNTWSSMNSMFKDANKLTSFPPEASNNAPNLSKTSDLSFMFQEAVQFNGDIRNWDVSKVTDMKWMFNDATAFNQNIGSWNVGSVTNMDSLFNGATAFNQNIGSWNVSSVNSMRYMFKGATAFNGNISKWDVSKVTNMGEMFRDATVFNQNIGRWDVSKVNNMSWMFWAASKFNQNIGRWDVSSVNSMAGMFENAIAFNGDISLWNVDKIDNMSWMFYQATAFNQNIGKWDVSSVNNMFWMFGNAIAFNQDLNWDVSKVTNMSRMFQNATAFNAGGTGTDIKKWNVSSVTNMNNMFNGASEYNIKLPWKNTNRLHPDVSTDNIFASTACVNDDCWETTIRAK